MKLFVYGTLLNHSTLSHVLQRLPRIKKAKIKNVKEINVKGYPTLTYVGKGEVSGEIFEVSDVELKKLDKWEEKYRRVRITLSDDTVAYVYLLG